MATLREFLNRWRDRIRRDALSAELEEELRHHRQMLERDAAHGANDRRLGNVTFYREEARAMWSLGPLDELLNDVRYALRAIRRTPGFSAVVTLTIALGIGATTAIYGVVDAVLIRPLPYPAPDALVRLVDVQKDRDLPVSYVEFRAWRAPFTGALSDIATWYGTGEVLQTADNAEQLLGARMTASLPAMLGVRPLYGRMFRTDEEAVGAPNVILLGESLWRRSFGGDTSIIGRTITLTGVTAVVIGIVPNTASAMMPTARDLATARPADFWGPLRLDDKNSPAGLHWLEVIGRVKPGQTLTQARERLVAVNARVQHDLGSSFDLHVLPLAPSVLGDVRTPLRLLLAAVAMLLIIACANVANLMLARTTTRGREFAVRAALGADRRRLLRLVAIESVVRATAGGALGVLIAYGLTRGGRAWYGAMIPRMASVSIDARVLVVALFISIAVGVGVGIVASLRGTRRDLVTGLRDGGRGVLGSLSRDRLRRTLIVGEIALSFVLLATAGLVARSFAKLVDTPKGFDASQLVVGFTWLPQARYPDSAAVKRFYDGVTADVSATLGGAPVTLASDVPTTGGTFGTVTVTRTTPGDTAIRFVAKRIVGANYFRVIGARIVQGRDFGATELHGSGAVIVNEAFAKKVFPNEPALGRQLAFAWGVPGYSTIVGVVADVREERLEDAVTPAAYITSDQRPNSTMNIVARTPVALATAGSAIRDALRRADPRVPLVRVQTMPEIVSSGVRPRRLTMGVLAAFAIAAVLLAAVGLYGVISYSVAQRAQELGVRAALGARGPDLMWLVLRQAGLFAVVGVSIGGAATFATRKLIATQLYGIGPNDPMTLAIAAAGLGLVALIASAVPTVRAARADPLNVLKSE